MADGLGMSRSTIHRYASTLVALGYLEQGESHKYRLGLRVTDLGVSVLNATGMREHAHPYLEELCRSNGYTVSLAMLDGTEIVYVDRARSSLHEQDKTELNLSRGSRLPAYCTAMGKLLLAHLPEDERETRIAGMTLSKHGPNTITSTKVLREELEGVQRAGFAVSDQELAPELYAIAAPVHDKTGDVMAAASIGTHSSTNPLNELVDSLGPELASTTDQISAQLGYRAREVE
jgi:IclR family pca regulon transcriptional regulator